MPTNTAEIAITAVAHGGDGIGRIDQQVCFVPGAFPGDKLLITLSGRSRGVLWGRIDKVLEPSPDRLPHDDDHPDNCGGCNWRLFAYPAQAQWKQRIVADALERIGGLKTEVAWLDNPELRTGYRTRARFHAANGRLGYFAPNSHTVVPIDSCPLCHPHLNEALATLQRNAPENEVEVTVNPEGDEVLVWSKARIRGLPPRMMAGGPKQPGERRQFTFDGAPIVNGAFSQSSLLLNRLLVGLVKDTLGHVDSLLDLYCGNGNFSLQTGAGNVLGLDYDAHATKAANAIGHGTYRAADESAFREALRQPWDAVVLDPPRTGAKAIINALAECKAQQIIYVSCDPATLARDLKTLTATGWQLLSTTAVDIFPNTPHIETVCQIKKA